MDGGVMPHLLTLIKDDHAEVATKGLLAASAMVRHHQQGLDALRAGGALQTLCG
jgi:hypothetical protein